MDTEYDNGSQRRPVDTDALVQALVAGAYGDPAQIAAVRMLAAASWLDREDFQAYIIIDHGRTRVEWSAAYRAFRLGHLRCSDHELIVLRLALSLVGVRRMMLTELIFVDAGGVRAVLGALATAMPSTQGGGT